MKQKIVLAYSGGLDTSFCAHYLTNEKNFEVHTVVINTGGFDEHELKEIEDRAYSYGSARHVAIDATHEYYEKCVRFLIYGNVLRNRNYPISVSSERTFQALKIIAYAKENNIKFIAHGSTGAGNDQVRFEGIFQVAAPGIEVLAPIRDLNITRNAEIEYMTKAGLEIPVKNSAYSINKGLWGTSVGGRETLSSNLELPDAAYPSKVKESGTELISIGFSDGEAVELNGNHFDDKIELIRELELLAEPWGVGRDVHVGETIIGIKGRVGFQAGAALLIINAHYSLEKHVLSKWQQHWKEQLGNWYGMFIHEGMFLEPSLRDIEKFLESTQRNVSGTVMVRLRPYSYQVTGVESKKDLMNSGFAQYGEENFAWTGQDVKGFTKIMTNPMKIYYKVNPEEQP
jgi:argininosuccinate synthase